MSNKTGQATIYLLIGVIILFSAVAIFYFQGDEAVIQGIPEITEEISGEMQPIRAFVQDCVDKTATDAVKMIGVHGGYIGLDSGQRKYTQKSFKLDTTLQRPTESDALSVSPDWDIPYWWYLSTNNQCSDDCAFESKMPYLNKAQGSNSIEEQIERYVDYNLPTCLNGFKSFESRGMNVFNTSGIKTTATIAREDVSVFVDYPLEVEWAGGKSTVSQFKVVLDVNLREMYELAAEITLLEANKKFLEMHTLNVISAYGGLDRNKLPPMAATELSFKPIRWPQHEVENNIKEKLTIYVNMLQATNTNNFDLLGISFPDDPIRRGLYSSMVIPLEGSYYEYEVKFNYLGWPMYVFLTGGGAIGPRDSINFPLASAILPIQRYDVPYDVSYPVMVSLYDREALKGEGYSFFFALESNVRNNEAMKTDTVEFFQASDVSIGNLCEENQRTSENVSFVVTDKLSKPVKDVIISFSLGKDACTIGFTDENGTFKGKFPLGAIGSLVLTHPEFAPYTITPFRAKTEPTNLGKIQMSGYIVKNVTAKKMSIEKSIEWNPFGSSSKKWVFVPKRDNLKNFENVTVFLERIPETGTEEPVVAGATLSRYGMAEMRLLPGKYLMRVLLIQNDITITIPPDEVCWEEEDGDEECETIPALTIAENGPFIGGQYEMEVEFNDDIYHDSIIQFTGLLFNLKDAPDKKHNDLNKYGDMPQKIADDPDLREYLLPKYKPIT